MSESQTQKQITSTPNSSSHPSEMSWTRWWITIGVIAFVIIVWIIKYKEAHKIESPRYMSDEEIHARWARGDRYHPDSGLWDSDIPPPPPSRYDLKSEEVKPITENRINNLDTRVGNLEQQVTEVESDLKSIDAKVKSIEVQQKAIEAKVDEIYILVQRLLKDTKDGRLKGTKQSTK